MSEPCLERVLLGFLSLANKGEIMSKDAPSQAAPGDLLAALDLAEALAREGRGGECLEVCRNIKAARRSAPARDGKAVWAEFLALSAWIFLGQDMAAGAEQIGAPLADPLDAIDPCQEAGGLQRGDGLGDGRAGAARGLGDSLVAREAEAAPGVVEGP